MITIRHIGKSAEDLRFFILMDGQHAGGITVHSVSFPRFSYGVAIAPPMRRRGAARAALPLLFALMKERGFSQAAVEIAKENAASLALHKSLGFTLTSQTESIVSMTKML